MNTLLNIISVSSAFIFGVGLIYIAFDATIGKLKFIHSKYEWNGLQIKDFAFLLIAAIILLTFFSFVRPY